MHVTILLLHVKRLQSKLIYTSNRAGWADDQYDYGLSPTLCDWNML